jgi:hypothetical protein
MIAVDRRLTENALSAGRAPMGWPSPPGRCLDRHRRLRSVNATGAVHTVGEWGEGAVSTGGAAWARAGAAGHGWTLDTELPHSGVRVAFGEFVVSRNGQISWQRGLAGVSRLE